MVERRPPWRGTDGTETVGSCVDAGGAPSACRSLLLDWFPNQIFWLVVTLVVIYLILSRVALPRIAAVLAERQGTITNDLAAAEELKLKAQEAERPTTRRWPMPVPRRQKIIGEAKAEIQGDLDAATAKADAEIAAKTAESEKAIAEIREDVVAALGGKADAKAIKSAIDAELKG
jgi:F-type H+-transporting ATPase subunit b